MVKSSWVRRRVLPQSWVQLKKALPSPVLNNTEAIVVVLPSQQALVYVAHEEETRCPSTIAS